MCKFCYKLGDESHEKSITLEIRSCMADQNLEPDFYNEIPSFDGETREISYERFSITAYKTNGDTRISVDHRIETDDGLIINPFTTAIKISFCPFCGDKISDETTIADDINDFYLKINDEEYDEKLILGLLNEDE